MTFSVWVYFQVFVASMFMVPAFVRAWRYYVATPNRTASMVSFDWAAHGVLVGIGCAAQAYLAYVRVLPDGRGTAVALWIANSSWLGVIFIKSRLTFLGDGRRMTLLWWAYLASSALGMLAYLKWGEF